MLLDYSIKGKLKDKTILTTEHTEDTEVKIKRFSFYGFLQLYFVNLQLTSHMVYVIDSGIG